MPGYADSYCSTRQVRGICMGACHTTYLTPQPSYLTPQPSWARVAAELALAHNVHGVAVAREVARPWLGLGLGLGLEVARPWLGLGLGLEVARP